jgi:hypothetical protein
MKVVIKNESGQYLSGTRDEILFVDRIERAFVYDFDEDRIAEQIRIVNARHGCIWSWQDVGDADGLLCLPKTPYTD